MVNFKVMILLFVSVRISFEISLRPGYVWFIYLQDISVIAVYTTLYSDARLFYIERAV